MRVIRTTILLIILIGSSVFAADYMAQADSLFALRNITFNDSTLLAESTQIDAALELYQTALDSAIKPEERLEAAWKILRAYYFKGTYTEANKGKRGDIYKNGIDFSKSVLDEFPESVELHCWTGLLWGYLGEVQGILTSARKGLAGKVKYHAEKTIKLDGTYLNGGGYRMLGTAHLKVPRIPLILGWPSKKKAVANLEKANQISPNNLYTMYYLADAYLATDQKDKAKKLLLQIINTDTLVHEIAVDATARHMAQLLYDKQFEKSEDE